MQLERHNNGFSIWFGKSKTGIGVSKTFTITFHPQHWKVLRYSTNGARRGIKEDRCFDAQFWAFGFNFNYVNWEYNQ